MPLRGGGWLQGYNCQAATSSDGLIIATSVGNNPSDATAFTTIMDKTVAAAEFIDAHQPTAATTKHRHRDRDRASRCRLPEHRQPHRPWTRPTHRGRQKP